MQQNDKLHALKQYFGYDAFRDGQESLIDSIRSGQDVLGVMPTGAGKSICFQLPAILMQGITLVISPLISLMKDQVNALTQAGIRAAYLNSSLSERQIGLAMENAANGAYKIIYIAPERLDSAEFTAFAANASIDMLAVDEAHCISQWGQDFRPSYLKIRTFIQQLPKRPVVAAFTATATLQVRADIADHLALENPKILVTGFDRHNLQFDVQKPGDKMAALLHFLSGRQAEAGVVYCATRNGVEEVCQTLRDAGFAATRYHAGLPDTERHRNQDDFLYDRANIMVATNAFGMGIDKSNVRFVVHFNMPKNIESYYQEAGRAGRDGDPAVCLLLYAGQDVRTAQYLIENNKDAVYEDEQTERLLKERDRQRLKVMTFYCHTNDCLRAYILRYFGEKPAGYCGNCSSCLGNFETVDVTVTAQKILSCVARVRERYGIKMIVDVLRGSKNEKVLRLGLDRLSTYGICREPEKRLRDIINHLILSEYLMVTDDEFPTLRLGPHADAVLRQNVSVCMKLVKEQITALKKAPKAQTLRPVNQELFAALAALRAQIAKEQRVPAYVVFTDSALTDMCIKLPATEAEFLAVSGVGQAKLERYGKAFLSAIAEFAAQDQKAAPPAETAPVLNPAAIYQSGTPVSVSMLADQINCELLRCGMKKLTGAKINDWLIEKGCLALHTDARGKTFKLPTEQGTAIGIVAEEREIRGENCFVNVYGEQAQRFIIEGLAELLASIK